MSVAPATVLRLGLLGALALALAGAAPAMAQPAAKRAPVESAGPSWQSLSPEQRATLAPLQDDWSSIDATRKAKWLGIAERYPKLPQSEQQRLRTRMIEWSRMTPSERAQARLNYKEAQQLPTRDRRDQWEAYKALPENQRQALTERGKAGAENKTVERAPKPSPELTSKRNIVPNPSHSGGPTRAVAPTVVQASPGATTTLVTRKPAPPAHQQVGMPKIAATPSFVDRNTLLPKRGPQVAGVRAPASAPVAKP